MSLLKKIAGRFLVTVLLVTQIAVLFSSCGGGGGGGGGLAGGSGLIDENILITDTDKRKWTIMVYMAADNDLEVEAMRNLNQLEAVSRIGNGKVTVLVLVDRTPGFDSTDGDWTDTRLYEIVTDSNGIDTTVASKRIACPALEITENGTKELDMSDYNVLQTFVTFSKSKYKADKYGLIMWGHGTGWRSSSARAYAVDDTTNNSMPIAQMRLALQNQGLTFIGFDTCFSANLETAYELKDCAKTIIGTPGLAPGSGWNYNTVFASIMNSDFSEGSLEDTLIASYRADYASVTGTAISIIDTSKVQALFEAFDSLAEVLTPCITTNALRTTMLNICMTLSRGYSAGAYPCDYFLDIHDYAVTVKNRANTLTQDAATQSLIETRAETLKTCAAQCVKKSWSHDNLVAPMGVHLIPLNAAGTPAATHSEAYRKGTSALYKPAMINDSVWWVPSNGQNGPALLDKLFYTTYSN